MANVRITDLSAVVAADITDSDVMILDDVDAVPKVSYKVTIAQLRTEVASPSSNGGESSGTSALRWSTVYGQAGNFSTTLTVSGASTQAAITASGLIAANAGATVASGQTLTLTGATVAGAPTWSSTQSLNTTGSAATLATTRTIWGQNFDGSANVSGAITGASDITATGVLSLGATVASAGQIRLPNNTSVVWRNAANSADLSFGLDGSNVFQLLGPLTVSGALGGVTTLTCTTVTATNLGGTLSTASQPNVTTMAALTTVGTIGTGVWQGTAITDTYLAQITTAGKVANSATTATNANNASTIVARDASGNFAAGTITAALTGNVTGNVTGSSGSCTGNAATATALATPRAINGTNFDGTAAITVTAAAGTLTGTTLSATVVTSSLTTVGALDSGSITSGFGSINIGTDAVTCGNIVSSGSLKVGGGATVAKWLTATLTWNPSNLLGGEEDSTTVTVTGAVAGDLVLLDNPWLADVNGKRLVLSGYVSAADTVTVVLRNTEDSSGVGISTSERTVRVMVMQF